MVGLAITVLAVVLALPFLLRILRAGSAGQALRLWLVQLAAMICLWAVILLVFHSGLVSNQRARVFLAIAFNVIWVGLVLAVSLGALAALVQAIRLRRKSGK